MSDEALKTLSRPPFAFYDLAVYFGCGLFAVPFVKHYVAEPFGLYLKVSSFDIPIPYAGPAVELLALLFAVYITGHMIAYLGSQLIGRAMDVFLGTTSTTLLISSYSDESTRNKDIRKHVMGRFRLAFRRQSVISSTIRAAFHLPAIPLYVATTLLGLFGFYASRIPNGVMDRAKYRFGKLGIANGDIALDTPWAKTLEYYTINNVPDCVGRMYNYLVIAGLFRSLSTIFLFCMWFEIYYLVHSIFGNHSHVDSMIGSSGMIGFNVFTFAAFSAAYSISLFSYLKFQRRYFEEAIWGFALTDGLVDTISAK